MAAPLFFAVDGASDALVFQRLPSAGRMDLSWRIIGTGGGTPLEAAVAFAQCAVAIGFVAAGLNSVARGRLAAWLRTALPASDALMIWPHAFATAAGLALGAAIAARQLRPGLAPLGTGTKA